MAGGVAGSVDLVRVFNGRRDDKTRFALALSRLFSEARGFGNFCTKARARPTRRPMWGRPNPSPLARWPRPTVPQLATAGATWARKNAAKPSHFGPAILHSTIPSSMSSHTHPQAAPRSPPNPTSGIIQGPARQRPLVRLFVSALPLPSLAQRGHHAPASRLSSPDHESFNIRIRCVMAHVLSTTAGSWRDEPCGVWCCGIESVTACSAAASAGQATQNGTLDVGGDRHGGTLGTAGWAVSGRPSPAPSG